MLVMHHKLNVTLKHRTASTHRKVKAEDRDIMRQQGVEGLLGVSAAAAVAVAVHHNWLRLVRAR